MVIIQHQLVHMLGTYHLVFFKISLFMKIVVHGGEKEINIHVHKNDCLSFICLNEHIRIDMIIVE